MLFCKNHNNPLWIAVINPPIFDILMDLVAKNPPFLSVFGG